ncbi:MAG: hypothetical protein J2P24_09940 [Streptosporangiales bacterium]|nr:hypothetical protein [Streptosporangiales bacterium]MBO0890768.1 hypothetical protein [Acidothermales bacterium]
MYALPSRPLHVVDAELRRVRENKGRFPSDSLQWRGAMVRIDRLLDERLVAVAESMWQEEDAA